MRYVQNVIQITHSTLVSQWDSMLIETTNYSYSKSCSLTKSLLQVAMQWDNRKIKQFNLPIKENRLLDMHKMLYKSPGSLVWDQM